MNLYLYKHHLTFPQYKVSVKIFERNPKARNECLRVHGTQCKICKFDAAKVYGIDFKDKIHVHHIVPIHKIGKDYKVNPSTDLIPVYPNCHMILHTKVNGVEPSIEELKQRFYFRFISSLINNSKFA